VYSPIRQIHKTLGTAISSDLSCPWAKSTAVGAVAARIC